LLKHETAGINFWFLSAVFFILNILDWHSTTIALASGAIEANPIAAIYVNALSPVGLLVFKILFVGAGIAILAVLFSKLKKDRDKAKCNLAYAFLNLAFFGVIINNYLLLFF
jgi:hypothetical protein